MPRGIRGRGKSFSVQEQKEMADLIYEHLPISGADWEQLASLHNEEWPTRTGTSLRKKFGSLHRKRVQTGNPNCPSHVRVAKHAWKKIVEKCEIGEGSNSDDSEFQGGEVELDDDEMEVEEEVTVEPAIEQERNILQLDIGQRINDAPTEDSVEHSNPDFVADPDANEGLVTETNLSDVLGSEAVSTITTSNSSAATTIRRATRKIVTPKSGLLVHKRSKRSKKDDEDNDDGGGLMEYMKLKMMNRMQLDEENESNRKLEARAEERRHEIMLAQMKIDSERQRADAQRQNMLMMMMLGKVMGTTINPVVNETTPFNFSPEREGTDEENN